MQHACLKNNQALCALIALILVIEIYSYKISSDSCCFFVSWFEWLPTLVHVFICFGKITTLTCSVFVFALLCFLCIILI